MSRLISTSFNALLLAVFLAGCSTPGCSTSEPSDDRGQSDEAKGTEMPEPPDELESAEPSDDDTVSLTYHSPAPTSYDTDVYRQTVVVTPDEIVDVHIERIERPSK